MPSELEESYTAQRADANLPVPDPTRLTTQLVDRALAAFREVMETRLSGLDKATDTHRGAVDRLIDANETQRTLLEADLERRLSGLEQRLMSEIVRVSDVSKERFLAVDTRFNERDERAKEQKLESRISLDAALAAAKEAVSEQNKANTLAIGKSEAATQKQIDSNAENVATNIRSLEGKIADLKERVDKGEGQKAGSTETQTIKRADNSQYLVIGLLVVAIVGLVVNIVLK